MRAQQPVGELLLEHRERRLDEEAPGAVVDVGQPIARLEGEHAGRVEEQQAVAVACDDAARRLRRSRRAARDEASRTLIHALLRVRLRQVVGDADLERGDCVLRHRRRDHHERRFHARGDRARELEAARVARAIDEADIDERGATLVDQQGALFANAGYPAEVVAAVREQQHAFVAAVADGSLPDEALAGLPRAYWEQFVAFDGAQAAVAAGKPALVVQGGADWQVPPANATVLAQALAAAQVPVDVAAFADLGHLLTHNVEGYAGIGEEYGMPAGFDARAVDAIVAWVRSH